MSLVKINVIFQTYSEIGIQATGGAAEKLIKSK